MNLFEKGIAIWAVALATGGIWLYTSSDRHENQPEPQPPIAVQAQPVPQPPASVQSKPDYFLRAKQAISEGMRDPDSVRFGKLFEGRGSPGKQTICGEVN